MAHIVTARAEILPDHTMVIHMPEEIPPGPVTVTVTVESPDGPQIQTFKDLLESGFVGMYADRDDLPKNNEEFREWRKRIWEGQTDDPS